MTLPPEILKLHFLVCEDFETMRILLTDDLKTLGVERASAATSGQTAFNAILASLGTPHPIGFVLTDLVMENGTGYELAKFIRADARTKHLPILMLTSKTEVGFVLEAIKNGVNAYLVKPWNIIDLHKKIIDAYKNNSQPVKMEKT